MLRTTAIILLPAALLIGCASKPKSPPVTPAATADQVEALRMQVQRTDPGARVGVVVAVLPEDRLAAVGAIPPGDLKIGDVVTFMDTQNRDLVDGAVVAKTDQYVHVKYAPPGPNTRAPVVGDMAIHLSPHPPVNSAP